MSEQEIDNAPLRDVENQAVRLLLEKERARERLAKKLKVWVPLWSGATTGLIVATQAGFFDWIAGFIIHMRNK